MKQIVAVLAVLILASCVHAGKSVAGRNAMTMQEINGLKLTSDGWVDTSSIESIVADATRGAQTDEEKVLALYNWYRRVVYHHRFAPPDNIRRNTLMILNSFGFNLCGSQSAVFVTLLQKAGFKTRVVCGKAEGDFGGHTFWEVFYDNRWHCFDTMTSFYVYTRDNPPHIASLEELKADPTLVTKAVEEKRASPAFLYCTFHQELKGADRQDLAKVMGEADLPWSTLLFNSGDLVKFWSQAPANSYVLDDKGTYGGRYTADVMDFSLRPGESLVRNWDNENKWIKNMNHADFGPHHVCGTADESDTVNFKYFEPYLKENYGHAKKCYRYYGNGRLEWKPTAALVQKFGKVEKMTLASGGRFETVADGSITIPVKCPYAVAEIELALFLNHKSDSAETRVVLLADGKSTEVWKRTGKTKGVEKIVISRTDLPLFKYELRIECKAGARGRTTVFPELIRSTFMENIAALPGLLPGKNVISVSAAAPMKLDSGKLVVQCDWSEGEDWKTARSITKELTELPAGFEIEAAGPKIPRMRSLTMRLE